MTPPREGGDMPKEVHIYGPVEIHVHGPGVVQVPTVATPDPPGQLQPGVPTMNLVEPKRRSILDWWRERRSR